MEKSTKKQQKKNNSKKVDNSREFHDKELELAQEVLREAMKAQEAMQEDDPYTAMAKKLEKQKRQQALRNAAATIESEEHEEEKKGPSSPSKTAKIRRNQSPEESGNEDGKNRGERKLEEVAQTIQDNQIPLRVWSRRIKIAVAALFVLSTAFMNGAFHQEKTPDGSPHGQLIDRELASEMVGMNNILLTLKESWFAIFAILAYFLLKTYNDYLDREEQRIVEVKEKEEKEYHLDDTDSTSQNSLEGKSQTSSDRDASKSRGGPAETLVAELQTSTDNSMINTTRGDLLNSSRSMDDGGNNATMRGLKGDDQGGKLLTKKKKSKK